MAAIYAGPERRRVPRIAALILPEAPAYKQAAGRIRTHLRMLKSLFVDQHAEREVGLASLGGTSRDRIPSP